MELLTLMEPTKKSNKTWHQISTLKPAKVDSYFPSAAAKSYCGHTHTHTFVHATTLDAFMDARYICALQKRKGEKQPRHTDTVGYSVLAWTHMCATRGRLSPAPPLSGGDDTSVAANVQGRAGPTSSL